MKRKYLIVLFIIAVGFCFGAKNTKAPVKKSDFPPGTVWLKDSIFIDEAEAKNLDYLEYLYWTRRVLGTEAWRKAMPDSTVWIKEYVDNFDSAKYDFYFDMLKSNDLAIFTNKGITKSKTIDEYIIDSSYYNKKTKQWEVKRYLSDYAYSMSEYYMRHPAFKMHPVVGVSYQQAVDYCKWRTDRVFEYTLIRDKIIKWNIEQTKDNYFTMDNFNSKKYIATFCKTSEKVKDKEGNVVKICLETDTIKYNPNDQRIKFYAEYSLPTSQEWEFAASFGNENNGGDTLKMLNCYNNKPNKFGMYNMHTNVSEMTNVYGIAKGGNFNMYRQGYNTINNVDYSNPSVWLGFRCVAKIKRFR